MNKCDTLQIMLRKDRNTENNYTRESSRAKQNLTVKQSTMESVKHNHTSRENTSLKPKVPTAAVNGKKRNARLQKDFLSTSPGKIRVRGIIIYYILVFYIFVKSY